jgi:hypothetical protein
MNGRPAVSRPAIHTVLAMSALGVAAAVLPTAPLAHADAVAYLVNVTVRPGYHFANADDALDYGHVLCDRVTAGQSYADVMTSVKSDFDNPDDYQASYLIDQTVNELCPAQIWQLRKSAAGYRPPAP